MSSSEAATQAISATAKALRKESWTKCTDCESSSFRPRPLDHGGGYVYYVRKLCRPQEAIEKEIKLFAMLDKAYPGT
jgi:hypothetical protein